MKLHKIYEIDVEIAQAFLALRQKAGLGQQELANRLGCTRSYICKVEKGVKVPTLEFGFLAERVFKCKLFEITGLIIKRAYLVSSPHDLRVSARVVNLAGRAILKV